MPSRKDLWEQDIWPEIYQVEDQNSRVVFILLYRMIRYMHDEDQLAQQIADKVNNKRFQDWTILQKIGAAVAGGIVLAESIKNLIGF